jgi:hypothetical protein
MQGLRVAYDHMIDSGFEELVRQADAAEALAAAAHSGGSSQQQQQPAAGAPRKPGAVQTAEMSLLRRPAVFTLAIVWDSPQARALITCAHMLPPCCA